MTTRIKLRRDTAENWLSANPILAAGEPGLETDTGKVKYGDGVTAWSAIEHTGGDALTNNGPIQVQTGDADRWLVRLRKEDETTDPSGSTGVIVYSTIYDSEGNVIVLGQVDLSNDEVVVFKFSSTGELVWKKALGVTNAHYPESYVALDSNDNPVFVLSPDSDGVLVVKLNSATGAVTFSNTIALGTSREIGAIAIDSDNKIYIGGRVYINETDYDIAFVAKLSATAEAIEWQKVLDPDSANSEIRGMAVDHNGDLIISGYTEIDPGDGNGTQRRILVAKLSGTTGSIAWQKTVTSEETFAYSEGFGLSVDSIGNIYVAGTHHVVNPEATEISGPVHKSNAAVVFKMSTTGTMVWDRRIGPGPCDWVGVSTAVGDDGDLYLYASTYQLRKDEGVTNNEGTWDTALVLARYNKTTGAVVWQSYFNNPQAQEISGLNNNNDPWSYGNPNTLDVFQDKIVIGGAVRIGPSELDQWMSNFPDLYFNQGFVAQFDTDATQFSVDGWKLETSRVPGRLTNTLVATTSSLSASTYTATTEGSFNLTVSPAKVSVRRSTSKTNTWTFGKDGKFTTAVDTNIKLQQTQLGYATMYGLWNNNEDDIWYESVVHDSEGYSYVVGSNNWSNDKLHIQKCTPEGTLVWSRQLHSGTGAQFNITSTDQEYTEVTVASSGYGYKIGDKIVLPGSSLNGNDGINSVTLSVASINNTNDGIGGVESATIVSGIAVSTNSFTSVQDYYDDADCSVRSIAYDSVTGNIAVLLTVPTFNGDTLDNSWTETLVLLIDSGSGAVVSSTALADEGDVYAYDISVSSIGKVAIVGEKFNEYNDYGAITALSGSAVDKLWVAKSDIDAEHFPGDNFSNYYDWWITGSNIADQVQVQRLNVYTGLTGNVRQGSGAQFTLAHDGSNNYTVMSIAGGSVNYLVGHKIKVLGSLIGGGTDGVNDAIITVTGADAGAITSATVTGTAFSTAPVEGWTVIGFNYQTGQDADFNLTFDPITGSITNSGIYSQVGQNYVVGDQIIISGTSFAGGTTPTNNITVEVTAVGSSGDLQNPVNFTGTFALTHLMIGTDGSVDFAAEGATFGIKQSLGGEAFVWTPDFNKAIGSNNRDWFSGVVWNSAGTHLYAVGSGRYEVTYDQALVVKFANNGTLVSSVSINANSNNDGAYDGAVALMADDSIVVVHTMYNSVRGNSDEVLVTKLDSDLNILWQQFLGIDSGGDGSYSPDGNVAVAVDPTTDEIVITFSAFDDSIFGDDEIYIIKLDTDGEVLWKRIFGTHENDVYICYNGSGNKALSISGDKFTIVGHTNATDNNSDNAVIFTLPLDGSGTGAYGIWQYLELNDNRIKVMRTDRTEDVFTPVVQVGAITATDNDKYYYTDYPSEEFTFFTEVIRNETGGALEFADGSKQSFSTAIVPQVKINNRYTIRPEDSGRHILVEMSNYEIIIPNYRVATLPVGFTFTIVNISGSTIYLENQSVNNGNQGYMLFSGGNTQTSYIGINDNGSGQMVTLMKIKEGITSDDGESHGDIWMIAGADISNND